MHTDDFKPQATAKIKSDDASSEQKQLEQHLKNLNTLEKEVMEIR